VTSNALTPVLISTTVVAVPSLVMARIAMPSLVLGMLVASRVLAKYTIVPQVTNLLEMACLVSPSKYFQIVAPTDFSLIPVWTISLVSCHSFFGLLGL